MKKIILILVLFAFLVGFAFLIDMLPPNGVSVPKKTAEDILNDNFAKLREKVADAGYEVVDTFVDAKFEGVVKAFSFKVNFDANTVATIPIILCEDEEAVLYNCSLLEGGIKLPIHNGCIFAYPGKDYPENVLNTVKAIVNGEEIPKNEFKKQ